LTGPTSSVASLRIGKADAEGNWPLQLTVRGLLKLSGEAYSSLMLAQNGKPGALCGTFDAGRAGSTTVTFSVPYRITCSTEWVVTKVSPEMKFPGAVVMTTA
jgi:hypothetical protein